MDLLTDPPANPDISKGYLDLLKDVPDTNASAAQEHRRHPDGSGLRDSGRCSTTTPRRSRRKLMSAFQLPNDWLNIPSGGIALDVGSGPGSVTATLGRAAGPDGLALGLDISEPMLARAVSAQAGPNVGFLRADAQQLPLRDETVDAAVSLAVLQLIPNPAATLAEMARVLRPGGRMAVLVPTAGTRRIAVAPGFPTVESTSSTKTNSATSSRTSDLSACARRASAASNGCAASDRDAVDSTREHRRDRPRCTCHRRRSDRHCVPLLPGIAAGVRGDPGLGRRRAQRHGVGDARQW